MQPTKTLTMPRRLVSIDAAADYLDVSTKTIRRMIARGQIPAFRSGTRLIRIDLAAVDAALQPIPTAGGGPDAA